jgi:hypothetical protein
MIDEKILTKEYFCQLVESSVKATGQSYMDAVLQICEEVNIDPDKSAPFLNMSIRDKIESEARDLNYLEKVNKLPI